MNRSMFLLRGLYLRCTSRDILWGYQDL